MPDNTSVCLTEKCVVCSDVVRVINGFTSERVTLQEHGGGLGRRGNSLSSMWFGDFATVLLFGLVGAAREAASTCNGDSSTRRVCCKLNLTGKLLVRNPEEVFSTTLAQFNNHIVTANDLGDV